MLDIYQAVASAQRNIGGNEVCHQLAFHIIIQVLKYRDHQLCPRTVADCPPPPRLPVGRRNPSRSVYSSRMRNSLVNQSLCDVRKMEFIRNLKFYPSSCLRKIHFMWNLKFETWTVTLVHWPLPSIRKLHFVWNVKFETYRLWLELTGPFDSRDIYFPRETFSGYPWYGRHAILCPLLSQLHNSYQNSNQGRGYNKGVVNNSLSPLGSPAQLRLWPPPQNPAEFLGGFSTIFFFTG
jgi:hypothetical protein